MNVALTFITVILMPTAPTQTVVSHVLANQVLAVTEPPALVSKDSIRF